MNLTDINVIKKLCQEYGIYPSKKLGQNFLIDSSVLDKIIKAGELKKDDAILEIGPGFGVLTQELFKHVDNLVLIEKDKRLAWFLESEFKQEKAGNKNLKIVNDDILNLNFYCHPELVSGFNAKCRNKFGMTGGGYKIISNLPYQITSPVLWKFLHEDYVGTRRGAFKTSDACAFKLSLIVLMMQKEVAERIVAQPGKMSVLSVMCQFYADCKIVENVGRKNFWPEPDVDSAIIKLKIKNEKLKINEKNFLKLVKIGFSAKRKMLKNNLSNGLQIPAKEIENILEDIKLNKKIRAQELSVKNWVDLYKKIK
ncbi:MAG: 16S rRNA (adenine(1518)-N(6)/adenine(1519)-N(6))-dimethyltransferase RsmA [Patescibacteria group bacterium]